MNLKNFYSFLLLLSISPIAKSALWAAQEESYHLKKGDATFAVDTIAPISQREGNSSQSNTQASTSISEFPNFNFSPDTESLCLHDGFTSWDQNLRLDDNNSVFDTSFFFLPSENSNASMSDPLLTERSFQCHLCSKRFKEKAI